MLVCILMSTVSFAQTESKKSMVYAAAGSGSSGGGDERGIGISLLVKRLSRQIDFLGESVVQEKAVRDEIRNIAEHANILILNEDLPATRPTGTDASKVKIQIGLAFSQWEKQADGTLLPLIQINAYRLKNEKDEHRKDLTLVHELFVLVGLEKTGDYTFTNKFDDALANNWRARAETNRLTICTVTAFELRPDYEYATQNVTVGNTLGQASLVLNGVSTAGLNGLIYKKDKKMGVFVNGVMDTSGYFRAEIVEGNLDFWPKDLKKILSEKIYYSPYVEKEMVPNEPTLIRAQSAWFLFSCLTK